MSLCDYNKYFSVASKSSFSVSFNIRWNETVVRSQRTLRELYQFNINKVCNKTYSREQLIDKRSSATLSLCVFVAMPRWSTHVN